jgi:glycolate oxidase FAD binding subunit
MMSAAALPTEPAPATASSASEAASALAQAAERIRDAAARSQPLCIRGGGSKAFYGEPAQAGETLSTADLSGIVSYEPSELVVTARAGTPLSQLEALLAAQGQCLPFEPPHFGGGATVGGMVAAGLSGPARASVGSVRDYVLGATVINGRGQTLVFGGQVMKNVAGYDVSRLLAGSMGTLGLIAEVSLKVLPVAPAEATLRFEMSQEEALRRLNEWGGQSLPLNASAWVDDAGVPTLYLRLRGAVAAVAAACQRLGGERLGDVAADWTASRDLRLPWFEARGDRDLWRLSVPQTAPVLALPDAPYIEWHGGQRWVRALPAEGEGLRRAAQAVGGHATLFIAGGPGAAARPGRLAPLAPTLERIHRDLKREFDPAGILNPGRLYPGF